jgi:hypothetical protein
MKKHLLLLLTLTLFAGLSLKAQQVYSNIVGMMKTSLPDGEFQIVSLQFPGNGSGVALDDAFTGLNDLTKIYIWELQINNSMGYTEYTYFDGVWYDKFGSPDTTRVINQGVALWIKPGSGGTEVIHSGEVPSSDSFTFNLEQGFNLITNPYPVPLKLSDISPTLLSDLDKVYEFTEAGYIDYTWFQGVWYDRFGTAMDQNAINANAFDAGKGVWLSLSGSGGELTFEKPY